MAEDYFTKMSKRTQPVRDALSRPSRPVAPATPKAPTTPKAPAAMKAIGQLQGESPEDWHYMRGAQDKINRKLAPKSVMGKSSSKR